MQHSTSTTLQTDAMQLPNYQVGSSYSSEVVIITTRGVRANGIEGLMKNDLAPVPVKVKAAALQELMKQPWLTANDKYGMPKTLDAAGISELLAEGLEKWYCKVRFIS